MRNDPTLLTPRLVLSVPRDDDRADFRALSGDPRVMRFFPSVQSTEQSDGLVARCQASFGAHGLGFFTVRRRDDASFVGFVGLSVPSFDAPFMPCVEVGWRLHVASWGQGYATEAAREVLRFGFEDHSLREIVSFTSVENLPSRRLMDRLGMHRDAAEDFDHPGVSRGHPLERHVLYRLSHAASCANVDKPLPDSGHDGPGQRPTPGRPGVTL